MRSSSNPSDVFRLTGDELNRRLVWLAVFRTVAVSLLLVGTAARIASQGARSEITPADSLSFGLIGLVYGLTLVYSVALRRGSASPAVAYVQVLGDVVLATCLVYLTGSVDSPFTFTYSIAVIAASILFFRRGAYVAAAASSVSFALLAILVNFGWLPTPEGTPRLPVVRIAFAIGSNVLSQALIAALASYLARQLSVTGGRLNAREADLRDLALLQRQILTAMPSGLITCDRSLKVTYVNRAAVQILSDRASDVGRHISELLPGVLEVGGRKRAELQVTTPSGAKTLGFTISELEEQDGGLLIVFQDLTELRRVEEELRRVDHLAALGRLSAQLAHEIRNPLAAMRGSAQMLAAGPGENPQSNRLLNIMVREADRLSVLVDDFLRFARPPPPALRPTDLGGLIRDTLEIFSADPLARGVQVETALSEGGAEVDPDQLRQVLLNLLRNAFAAAGSQGRVRVALVDDGDGRHLRLEVWDSGGSIPAEHLPRLFEPFFSTKQGGTGLGLSTAYSIVAAHGGSIRVNSSPDAGTTFSVHLRRPRESTDAHPGR